jgi:hypothetical protein
MMKSKVSSWAAMSLLAFDVFEHGRPYGSASGYNPAEPPMAAVRSFHSQQRRGKGKSDLPCAVRITAANYFITEA